MDRSYAVALGTRMRAIRNQQGLSLHGVERKSNGVWKAVVIGSYERGDRAVSVQRLAHIADFYGVPLHEMLPTPPTRLQPDKTPRLALDLTALPRIPAGQGSGVTRFTAAIQERRGDYNGKVLTVREDDLFALSIIYDVAPGMLLRALVAWGVLIGEPSSLYAGLNRNGGGRVQAAGVR